MVSNLYFFIFDPVRSLNVTLKENLLNSSMPWSGLEPGTSASAVRRSNHLATAPTCNSVHAYRQKANTVLNNVLWMTWVTESNITFTEARA